MTVPDGLAWLMRPVLAKLCHYESLQDGTLDLADIAFMNDMLDVEGENMSRARAAAEAEARTR